MSPGVVYGFALVHKGSEIEKVCPHLIDHDPPLAARFLLGILGDRANEGSDHLALHQPTRSAARKSGLIPQ
jgi:hypothetical protein